MERLKERRRELATVTLNRLAAAPFVVLAITATAFALASQSPLNPLRTYLGEGLNHTSEAARTAAATTYGLNDSFLQAWWHWLGNLTSGDAGYSQVFSQPVTSVFAERVPWTVGLSAAGLATALACALFVGWAAARAPEGLLDRALNMVALVFAAVPSFVVALGSVSLFSITLGWLPVAGIAEPGEPTTVSSVLIHAIAPTLVLASSQMPWMMLAIRRSTLSTLDSPAVTAATLRGVPDSRVRCAHVAPVALIPLIALIGSRLPEVLVGALIVESVFSWPGIAAATVDSALGADFAMLAAITAVTTVGMLAGSWAADCALMIADPRVKSHA